MINSSNSLSDLGDCGCCWEPLDNGVELRVLHPSQAGASLQHIFHRACIDPWLQQQPTCPMCSRVVEGVPVETTARGRAVIAAVENNDQQLAFDLLASGPITEKARGEAVFAAAAHGNQDLVSALLASGPLTEESRGGAVFAAVNSNNEALVTILLNNGPITEEHRGVFVKLAVEKGHRIFVATFLANGPISEIDRDEAVAIALKRGDLRTISLFPGGTIILVSITCVLILIAILLRLSYCSHREEMWVFNPT